MHTTAYDSYEGSINKKQKKTKLCEKLNVSILSIIILTIEAIFTVLSCPPDLGSKDSSSNVVLSVSFASLLSSTFASITCKKCKY